MKRLIIALVLLSPVLLQVQEVRYKGRLQDIKFQMPTALADTMLDGSAVFTTDTDKANFVRYYYYIVNGAAPGYTITNRSYMSQVNSILSGIGTVMANMGFGSCADIPTSGTFSEGPYLGTISAGSKTIPSSFPNDAGQTFDKKITVSFGGETAMEMQLKCAAGSTIVSGNFLLGSQAMTQGTMNEIIFQLDTASDLIHLDYVVTFGSSKIVTRFVTTDGRAYKLYTMYLGLGSYNAVAINGTANGKTNFNIVWTNGTGTTAYSTEIDDISGITNGMNEKGFNSCLDMGTNTSTTGCTAITAPGTFSIGGSTYNFRFNSMASLTTSSY